MAGEGGEVGFDTISRLLTREKGAATLQAVDKTFYPRAQSYIVGLDRDYREAFSKDPTSRPAQLLHDELRKGRHRLQMLWEQRERKIALAACRAKDRSSPPPQTATPEERVLFTSLVSQLHGARQVTLHGATASASSPTSAPPPSSIQAPADTPMLAPTPPAKDVRTMHDHEEMEEDALLDEPEPSSQPPPSLPEGIEPEESVLVEVIEDVPSFSLGDRDLALRAGDSVTLPGKVVRILAARGSVRILDA